MKYGSIFMIINFYSSIYYMHKYGSSVNKIIQTQHQPFCCHRLSLSYLEQLCSDKWLRTTKPHCKNDEFRLMEAQQRTTCITWETMIENMCLVHCPLQMKDGNIHTTTIAVCVCVIARIYYMWKGH